MSLGGIILVIGAYAFLIINIRDLLKEKGPWPKQYSSARFGRTTWTKGGRDYVVGWLVLMLVGLTYGLVYLYTH